MSRGHDLPADVSPAGVTDCLLHLFTTRGASLYGGELVTQLEHALQSAWLAEQDNRPAADVVAALLHDVGHLLHELGEDCAEEGIDDIHEQSAADWLCGQAGFNASVTEPIRLHVQAKRHLCATDPEYHTGLSYASKLSLSLQGGAFSDAEVAAFLQNPYSDAALRLRGWDDRAKTVGLQTPSLSHFLAYIDSNLFDQT
ncbi:MAG: phosphohydrolase [Planctomycetaceae bacterium]|jgi:phosphonate degradation associated HDIG domain protein|nr:phosphohydrolase [Planctomycetaceae bacterium]